MVFLLFSYYSMDRNNFDTFISCLLRIFVILIA